jgi:hypothetical protein
MDDGAAFEIKRRDDSEIAHIALTFSLAPCHARLYAGHPRLFCHPLNQGRGWPGLRPPKRRLVDSAVRLRPA